MRNDLQNTWIADAPQHSQGFWTTREGHSQVDNSQYSSCLFLYTGAHFRITGKVLSLIPLLIIVVKGADISSAANFRSLGGKSSHPEDFFYSDFEEV